MSRQEDQLHRGLGADSGQVPSHAEIESIVHKAASICGTPMALISFVDEHRRWMSAGVGIEPAQTPQMISFCTHAIRAGGTTVVEDGLNDLRLATNPLIRGGAGLRFYAGVPLRTAGGTRLGTLAALDRQARSLSADHVEQLEQLAECAVAMLETARGAASASMRQAAAT